MKINIENSNLTENQNYEIGAALMGVAEIMVQMLNSNSPKTLKIELPYDREIEVTLNQGEFYNDDRTLCTSCGEYERTGLITEYPESEKLCEECEADYQTSKHQDEIAQLVYHY
jgi:hypothetical protein